MYSDQYTFITVLEFGEKGTVGVYFPDLPGCTSGAETAEKAAENAKIALMLHLYGMETDGDIIPKPSALTDIKPEKNEIPLMVEVYMPSFREKMLNRSVKKTCASQSG